MCHGPRGWKCCSSSYCSQTVVKFSPSLPSFIQSAVLTAQAVPLSKDHKPDAAFERDRIARAGGYVEPTLVGSSFQGPHRVWLRRQVDGGLAISRSLGDTALEPAGVVPQPDVIKQTVTPQDRFVVMASDGVWDQLSNDQVVAIASMHDDPRHASSAIVKEARRRWERDGSYVDDITAMVIKM